MAKKVDGGSANSLALPATPHHLSTVMCDHITEDKKGKTSLIGMFQTINVSSFPGGIPRFFISVVFSSLGLEGATIEVQLVESHGDWVKPIAEGEIEGELPFALEDRFSATVTLNVPVVNVKFPRPGLYEVRVSVNGELCHRFGFAVAKAEAG